MCRRSRPGYGNWSTTSTRLGRNSKGDAMTLRESKQLIRRWISERFSDERLAQVYAFNQDGKMRFQSACDCLLGVTGSPTLHEPESCRDDDWPAHYFRIRYNGGQFALDCEQAYNILGWLNTRRFGIADCSDELRKRRLSAILRAQMRIRARARQQEGERVCV